MSSRQLEETVSSALTVSRETSLIVDSISKLRSGWHNRVPSLGRKIEAYKHISGIVTFPHIMRRLFRDVMTETWFYPICNYCFEWLTSYKSSLTVIKHRVRMYSSPQILLLACLYRFTWNIHRIDSITWVSLETAISETGYFWLCYISLILIVLLKSGVSI